VKRGRSLQLWQPAERCSQSMLPWSTSFSEFFKSKHHQSKVIFPWHVNPSQVVVHLKRKLWFTICHPSLLRHLPRNLPKCQAKALIPCKPDSSAPACQTTASSWARSLLCSVTLLPRRMRIRWWSRPWLKFPNRRSPQPAPQIPIR